MAITLNLSKKAPARSARPAPARRKPAFGGDDSDDDNIPAQSNQNALQEISTFDEDTSMPIPQRASTLEAQTKSRSGPPPKLKPIAAAALQAPSISSLRSTTQATLDVDESLYNYDDFLSARNAVDRERKAATSTDSIKGPNYVSDLLAAAEQRKRDQERARDKLLQKQREDEGDEFKDKEAFVTEAYKLNQEETRKAEEAEKIKEEEERKRRDTGAGMTAFHRKAMDEEDKRHREVLEAASRMKDKAVAPDDEADKEDEDLELARKLKAQGRAIDINDDGEITDKRALLSGGLNVVAKPKSAVQSSADAGARAQTTRPQNFGQSWDAKRAMRERQSKMVAAQLEQVAKRAAEEEAEELQKKEMAAKSQKTHTDISSAKERYLQRKREAAEAAAKGGS